MALARPDSGYSWAIVICCSYVHFALFGLFRSAGVMYVALLDTYGVTREEASWPFSLCSAVFQLTGPVASILTHYISQRKACLLGSAIATLGVAGCYFAESITWINVFYGIIHGLGFGLIVTLIPVILNQYFVKHRATAIGIAFSGGTISSFIFPIAMEWMLENYSLKGSFLLLGGVVMNTLVASSLLRPPPWLKKNTQAEKFLDDAKDSGVFTSPPASASRRNGLCSSPVNSNEDSIHLRSDLTEKTQTGNGKQTSSSDEPPGNLDTVCSNDSAFGESDTKTETKLNPKADDPGVEEPLISSYQVSLNSKQTPQTIQKPRRIKIKCPVTTSTMEVLRQPKFHLICFTMCIYFLGIHSFFMVIVDFAKDKGIPESKGIYILSMFSLTDLFGRACLGWVTDRNFIQRKNMVILNLAIIGVLNQIYPLINALAGILVVAAIHGLAVGSSITLFFVLQAEYLGMKNLTLVIGLTSFINGTTTLFRPAMIGLFRDIIGSYNWMFHFLGTIALAFSGIWLLESVMTKNAVRDQNKV